VTGEGDALGGSSEHWFDYYDIAQGPGGAAMPGPIAVDDLSAARSAADSFRGTAIKLAGEDAPGAAQSSFLTKGFPVISLGLNSLNQSAPGGGDDLLAGQASQVIFPIMLGDRLVASATAQKAGDQWKTITGDPAWVDILVKVRSRHAAANHIPEENYFLVDARALGLFFLGIRIGRERKLIPTLDEPELGFKAGDTLSANDVIAILKKLARTHNNMPM
jgi:hypothetical protein